MHDNVRPFHRCHSPDDHIPFQLFFDFVFPPQTGRVDEDVYENHAMRVATGVLNEILAEAVAMQQPPSDKGKRLRLYYITQAAVKPPTFVI